MRTLAESLTLQTLAARSSSTSQTRQRRPRANGAGPPVGSWPRDASLLELTQQWESLRNSRAECCQCQGPKSQPRRPLLMAVLPQSMSATRCRDAWARGAGLAHLVNFPTDEEQANGAHGVTFKTRQQSRGGPAPAAAGAAQVCGAKRARSASADEESGGEEGDDGSDDEGGASDSGGDGPTNQAECSAGQLEAFKYSGVSYRPRGAPGARVLPAGCLL